MSNISKMYWLTRLDTIQGLCIGIIALSVIGLTIYYLGLSSAGTFEYSETKEKEKRQEFLTNNRWIKKAAYPLLILSALICTFLPSKNDMILIYAGGKTMDFVQKDTSINKIPYQTTKIISDYLDKAMKDIKK